MMMEYKTIDGYSFTLEKVLPFEKWLNKNYGSMNKFNDLKTKDKEKVFLRWKWGMSDEEANENLEISERLTLGIIKDFDFNKLNEAYKFYFEQKLWFDDYCYQIKQRLGLIESPKSEEYKKIMETFEAQEI